MHICDQDSDFLLEPTEPLFQSSDRLAITSFIVCVVVIGATIGRMRVGLLGLSICTSSSMYGRSGTFLLKYSVFCNKTFYVFFGVANTVGEFGSLQGS